MPGRLALAMAVLPLLAAGCLGPASTETVGRPGCSGFAVGTTYVICTTEFSLEAATGILSVKRLHVLSVDLGPGPNGGPHPTGPDRNLTWGDVHIRVVGPQAALVEQHGVAHRFAPGELKAVGDAATGPVQVGQFLRACGEGGALDANDLLFGGPPARGADAGSGMSGLPGLPAC